MQTTNSTHKQIPAIRSVDEALLLGYMTVSATANEEPGTENRVYLGSTSDETFIREVLVPIITKNLGKQIRTIQTPTRRESRVCDSNLVQTIKKFELSRNLEDRELIPLSKLNAPSPEDNNSIHKAYLAGILAKKLKIISSKRGRNYGKIKNKNETLLNQIRNLCNKLGFETTVWKDGSIRFPARTLDKLSQDKTFDYAAYNTKGLIVNPTTTFKLTSKSDSNIFNYSLDGTYHLLSGVLKNTVTKSLPTISGDTTDQYWKEAKGKEFQLPFNKDLREIYFTINERRELLIGNILVKHERLIHKILNSTPTIPIELRTDPDVLMAAKYGVRAALKNIDSFNCNPVSYIWQSAKNSAINYIKKTNKHRNTTKIEDLPPFLEVKEKLQDEKLANQEILDKIYSFVQSHFSNEQQQIYNLWSQGYENKEISNQMQIKSYKVGRVVSEINKKVREKFSSKYYG